MLDWFYGLSPWMQALASAALGIGIGLLLERVVLERLRSWAQKTAWKGDDVIVAGVRGQIVFIAAVTGLYLGIRQLGYTELLGYNIYFTVIVLLITFSLTKIASQMVQLYTEKNKAIPTTSLFTNLTRAAVFILGLLVVFQGLGVQITPLLGALGIGGLAVALALEDTLKNMFAGLYIMATQKFKPGDYIEVEGIAGHVHDVNWRVTTLKTLSKDTVLIPNSDLETNPVTNFTQQKSVHTVTIPVEVGYDSDLEQVERVTVEVAQSVMNEIEDGESKYQPVVRFSEFGGSGIGMNVLLRLSDRSAQFRARHRFIMALHKRYGHDGIDIPYPTRTIYTKKG